MFEGLYLNEGGQSAAGALLDFIIDGHVAAAELTEIAAAMGVPLTAALNDHLGKMAKVQGVPVYALAHDVHVTPDFAGSDCCCCCCCCCRVVVVVVHVTPDFAGSARKSMIVVVVVVVVVLLRANQ